MSIIAIHDPCILFALGQEAGPFLREFPPHQRFADAPCWARFCGPVWLTVLVLQTGVGPERMQAALSWLLNQPMLENVPCRPKLVLSAGYSGALTDGHDVGDLILATDVVDPAGQRWPASWPGELSGEWRPPLHRGRLLGVPRLVGDPAEKRRLGTEHAALAVDMESAIVARLCTEQEVPFGCLRVISDRVDTALDPRLAELLGGRGVSVGKLLKLLLRSPGLVAELARLARQTRRASRQLAAALGELLTLTLD